MHDFFELLLHLKPDCHAILMFSFNRSYSSTWSATSVCETFSKVPHSRTKTKARRTASKDKQTLILLRFIIKILLFTHKNAKLETKRKDVIQICCIR